MKSKVQCRDEFELNFDVFVIYLLYCVAQIRIFMFTIFIFEISKWKIFLLYGSSWKQKIKLC